MLPKTEQGNFVIAALVVFRQVNADIVAVVIVIYLDLESDL